MTLRNDAIAERFDALSSLLVAWRDTWAVAPFRHHRPPWVDQLDGVAAWLLSRTPEEIRAIELERGVPGGPPAWQALVDETSAIAWVGPHPAREALRPRDPLARRVRGRKWAQVRGFLAASEGALGRAQGPVIEWCSGRGHLGRALAARLGHGALLLEIDPDLCAPPAGTVEAPDVRHVCVDVLDPAVGAQVPVGAGMVGLHACGTLTDRLVEVALERRADAVASVPCCPHRLFDRPRYRPASARGRAAGLDLGPDDLRLAALDEVVVRPRRRAQRDRELVVRVAVDLLVREATGQDVHRSFATVDRARFEAPIAEVVPWVAATFDLPLPASWSPEVTEARATALARDIRALASVRARFRRPLELWLVLDRALRLREAGYDVEVGTFCTRTDTPRNLLVLATRPDGGQGVHDAGHPAS